MSEPSHLPDDPSAWPRDPHRLLGVARDADERAIRRAYLALIRRFKPEHAPDAFRRIRAAFEAAQQAATGPFGAEEPEFDPPAPAPRVDRRPPPDLWGLAVAGDADRAYRGLVEAWRAGANAEGVFLQLYWLGVAAPEVDPDLAPAWWLVRGLRAGDPESPRLRELLRREARVEPASTLGPPWADLLAPGTPVPLARFAVDWRWRAARRRRTWEVVAADVAALRPWLADRSPAAWAWILLRAAETLAWAEPARAAHRRGYLDEAERLAADLRLDLDAIFERVDHAEVVTAGLRQRGWPEGVADELADLLRECWDDRGPDLAPRVHAFARALIARPAAALARLDATRNACPAALGLLLDLLGSPATLERPDQPTVGAIDDFLGSARWETYPQLRAPLLAFCLRERISPLVVAWAVDHRDDDAPHVHLPRREHIAADWALLAAYRAGEVAAG